MFEDKSVRRKRRLLIAAAFLLLASVAFGVGYFFNIYTPDDSDYYKKPKTSVLQIPDSLINPTTDKKPYEEVNADSNSNKEEDVTENKLSTPNTQLIFKAYYNFCGHTAEKAVQAAGEEANMDEQQLMAKYSGWEITGFSPPIVEFSRKIDAYCPKHFIIGVDDGFITIYVYNENGKKVMQEKTDISAKTLTPEDQQALSRGIVVDTEEQKEQTLEGFSN